MSASTTTHKAPHLPYREFLATTPIGVWVTLTDVDFRLGKVTPPSRMVHDRVLSEARAAFNVAVIGGGEMHCPKCDGPRQFDTLAIVAGTPLHEPQLLRFTCKNCGINTRTVVLLFEPREDPVVAVMKFAETPASGGRLSRRLVRLAGSDEDVTLLRKAKRAEALGFGVGAFVYYRQFLERKRTKLFRRAIAIAEHEGGDPEPIRKAMMNKKFKRGFDEFPIPDGLKLRGGSNPFTLLYSHLSGEIHEFGTDEQCLFKAESIREVLEDLVERLDRLGKKHVRVTEAETFLLQNPPPSDEREPDA